MKIQKWYILMVGVLLLLGILSELNRPRAFNWNPDYEHRSTQPLGCAIFDSMVSHTMPRGYRATGKTLYALSQDSSHLYNILGVGESFYPSELEMKSLFKLLDRGSKVMLVYNWYDDLLCDTLGFAESLGKPAGMVSQNVIPKKEYDTLYMASQAPDGSRFYKEYVVLSDLLQYGLAMDGDPRGAYDRVAEEKKHKKGIFDMRLFIKMETASPKKYSPITMGLKVIVGKGELYLIQTPHLFTNYGMLSRNYYDYVFRCLNSLKDRELLRLDESLSADNQQIGNDGPFSYMLRQPPLRWALYTGLCVVLLFLCFTARRKQRAIPVVRPPQNMQLKFVKFIGTLYFERETPLELLKRKFSYFAEEVYRLTGVDVRQEEVGIESLASALAQKTGMERDALLQLLATMRKLPQPGMKISDKEMKHWIDRMNEVVRHCR